MIATSAGIRDQLDGMSLGESVRDTISAVAASAQWEPALATYSAGIRDQLNGMSLAADRLALAGLGNARSAFTESVRDTISMVAASAQWEPALATYSAGIRDQLNGVRDVLLDLSGEQVAGPGQLWLPATTVRPSSKLTPEQALWLLVILTYVIGAVAQHASSFVAADNPTFDLEKFVSQQVQAFGLGLGMYGAVLARRALRPPAIPSAVDPPS
jgi:hypothetical protein